MKADFDSKGLKCASLEARDAWEDSAADGNKWRNVSALRSISGKIQ